MNYFSFMQMPAPSPAMAAAYVPRIAERADRLNSQRLDLEKNCQLRAELDPLIFHVYKISSDDVDYILETFPIVKRKDLAAHGTYRSKDRILAAYGQMQAEVPV